MSNDKLDDALVSIVIPVYNVEAYLHRCVDSVLHQTYDHLEIILIDDGSEDQSGKIVDEFSQIDKRVKIIHKKNEGLAEARNDGIKEANGRFIMFVDSDDFIHERTVEVLLAAMIRMEAQIGIGCVEYVFGKKEYDLEKQTEYDVLCMNQRDAIKSIYSSDRPVDFGIICNKLFERNLFNEIVFPKGKFNEDDAVIVQLYYSCNQVAYVKKKTYFYYQRSDSIMGQKKNINNVYKYDFFRSRDKLFCDNKDEELCIMNAIRVLDGIYSEYYQYHKQIKQEMLKCSKTEVKYYIDKYKSYFSKHNKRLLLKGYLYRLCPLLCYFMCELNL